MAPMATQNSPPEVRFYPPPAAAGQNESTDVGLKDPYFFFFSSRAFSFVFRQPDGCLLKAVAFAFELEQVAPVKETIQDGRRGGVVAQELSPIFQRTV